MATLPRRLSQLVGWSGDSAADSEFSTRAARGHADSIHSENSNSSDSVWSNRINRVRSTDSGYETEATSNSDDAATPKATSPRAFTKAASNIFQNVSNSLRLKAQHLYSSTGTENAQPATPRRSVPRTPEKPRDGFVDFLVSSTKRKLGRNPRSLPADLFVDPRTASPQAERSPGSPGDRSVKWSSIRARANKSPRASNANSLELDDSPQSKIDDFAPSLNVDIPDGSIIMAQLMRSRSKVRGSSPFAIGKVPSDPDSEPMSQSKGADNANVKEQKTATSTKGTPTPSRVRFSEPAPESTPSRIPLPQTPTELKSSTYTTRPRGYTYNKHGTGTIAESGKTDRILAAAEPRNPRARSLETVLDKLPESNTTGDGNEKHVTMEGLTKADAGHAESFGQKASTDSPDPPSMGSPSVWKQAQEDRQRRYLETTETDEDTESEFDLGLVRFPGSRQSPQICEVKPDSSRSKVVSINKDSPETSQADINHSRSKTVPVKKDSYDNVERIVKSWARRLNLPTSMESDFYSGVGRFTWDPQYDVEAIEREPGSIYYSSDASSSAGTPGKARLLGSPPHIVISPSKPSDAIGSTDGSPSGIIASAASTARKELHDLLLADVETPVKPKPSSSTGSVPTPEGCAVTTHHALCYAPIPSPSRHVRSSPVVSPRVEDGAADLLAAEAAGTEMPEVTGRGTVSLDRICFEESPRSKLRFDGETYMKHIFKPLTPSNKRTTTDKSEELQAQDDPMEIRHVQRELKLIAASSPSIKSKPSQQVHAEPKLAERGQASAMTHNTASKENPLMGAPNTFTAELPIRLKAQKSLVPLVEEPRKTWEKSLATDEESVPATPPKMLEPLIPDLPSASPQSKKKSPATIRDFVLAPPPRMLKAQVPDLPSAPSQSNKKSPAILEDNVTATPPKMLEPQVPDPPSPSPQSKKNRRKMKKALKNLSWSKKSRVLEETSGNSGRKYSFSQIVKGERQRDTLQKAIDGTSHGVVEDIAFENSKENDPPSHADTQEERVQWTIQDRVIGQAGGNLTVFNKQGSRAMNGKPNEANEEDDKVRSSIKQKGPQELDPAQKPAFSLEGQPWPKANQDAVAKHLCKFVYDVEAEAATEIEEDQEEDELAFKSAD